MYLRALMFFFGHIHSATCVKCTFLISTICPLSENNSQICESLWEFWTSTTIWKMLEKQLFQSILVWVSDPTFVHTIIISVLFVYGLLLHIHLL